MSGAAALPKPGFAALTARLAAMKTPQAQANRPASKAVGRWLGDFLTCDDDYGLLPAELDLLYGCTRGEDVYKSAADDAYEASTEAARKAAREAAREASRAAIRAAGAEARKTALAGIVADRRVRAKFLRFLVLGGDDTAPVHEKGIQLSNTRIIDDDLDLRSGKCVSRIALTNCILDRELCIQDATFDVLVLSGSRLRALRANRAKILGAMWLNENFIADAGVELFGIEIGGRLDASYGHFAAGIAAPGAEIGGDLNLTCVTAEDTISFINAEIGGSVIATSAIFSCKDASRAALDLSRAKVKGDVSLGSATITAAGWTKALDRCALNAQNMTVNGSFSFGGGFRSNGMAFLYGAEISKDLDFAGSTFCNQAGSAIVASLVKAAGNLNFRTSGAGTGNPLFQSFGAVTLGGSVCGELNCSGARFTNPNAATDPTAVALDCNSISVARTAFLNNDGKSRFAAFGKVNFQSAQIGQDLVCAGGDFCNPRGVALTGEAAKVSGVVFLGSGITNYADPDPATQRENRTNLAFRANGEVRFLSATVGDNVICMLGRFHNAAVQPGKRRAATALNLSTAKIGNILFLGRETADEEPPVIEGSVDLTGATVRMLVDDGFIDGDLDGQEGGLRVEVAGKRCDLLLDQFTYERLKGDQSCDAHMRMAWLRRQPPEDLDSAFKPQPFEQLVTVMRAMGYDDAADDIALSKRRLERKASSHRNAAKVRGSLTGGALRALWGQVVNGLERVFIDDFIGYGYHMGRAVFVLLLLCGLAAGVDDVAFQQGAIVPADKEIRTSKFAQHCLNWTQAGCPLVADEVIPRFQPVIYSADVIIPVIGFGQKAAWTPANDARWLYWLQLFETIVGWVGGSLLAAFVTGLLGKE